MIERIPNAAEMTAEEILSWLTAPRRDRLPTADAMWSYAGIAERFSLPVAETIYQAITLAIRNDIAAIDWTARALLSGTVGTVTSNSDFTLVSDDLSPTDNQYRGCWLTFETGNNVSVARFIGAYTGATKRVQFTGGGVGRGAFTSDVVAGDQWRLMPTTDLVAGIFGVRPS